MENDFLVGEDKRKLEVLVALESTVKLYILLLVEKNSKVLLKSIR